jgi:hypothetical protein
VRSVGRKIWAIPEGYIPGKSVSDAPDLVSREAICLLNTGDPDAHVTITLFFADRDPAGPYRVSVPSRRTLHLRTNDLSNPEPVPRDTDYAVLIESTEPVVVQHTRLDSRNPDVALLSTMAYAVD